MSNRVDVIVGNTHVQVRASQADMVRKKLIARQKQWDRFIGKDRTVQRLANAGSQLAGWLPSPKQSVVA